MEKFVLIAVIALCFFIFGPILVAISLAKNAKTDDKAPEQRFTGKIIEKTTEYGGSKMLGVQVLIEQIVFEKEDGSRVRLRNVRTKDIILGVGDAGTVTVRGETIYAFVKREEANV